MLGRRDGDRTMQRRAISAEAGRTYQMSGLDRVETRKLRRRRGKRRDLEGSGRGGEGAKNGREGLW